VPDAAVELDELAIGIALFDEPVGVDEPRAVVVGRGADRSPELGVLLQ
jgi:hypothetical protein